MRLKTIKLAGFKSFVDPTTVNFPSNMAAVVGPNGCGKSNIIDAVRWVMGESSAKTLRGESMTDVIFNGTTHRKPVGQASIELIFDNSDGSSGGEYAAYAEISVRRMVSRDGGSEYYLNGSKCRRRDITDLFLGTGLGPRSYAIIEQGMISRLIESKPEELRVFIEEAAGISKYKERRRETENRMRRTVENLERLTDLREELERQLSHLQRQAQAAERYAEYKKEEREAKAQLLGLQWRELQQETDTTGAKLGELEVGHEAARADYQKHTTEIEQLRVAHTDATDHFNEVQAEFYSIGGEVTRVEQALKYEAEKRIAINNELAQTKQSLSQIAGHMDSDRARLEQWESDLESCEPQQAELRAAANAASEAQVLAEEAMNEWQATWEEFTGRAAGPKQTAEVQQSRIVYLEQVMRRLQERISKLDEERTGISGGDSPEDVDAIDEQIALIDEQVAQQEVVLEESQRSIATHRETIENLRHRQDNLRSDLQRLKGQQASLVALQEAATSDKESQALSSWLSQHSVDVKGSLFESLTVQEGWEASVEQVLGDALTAAQISDLPNLLEGGLSGLPSGAFITSADSSASGDASTLAGKVQGPLAIQFWLANIKTASSLEEAIAMLPSLSAEQSVITPAGEWLGKGWARVRSAADAATGVIERSAALEEVRATIEMKTAELESVDEDLERARSSRADAEQATHDLQQQLKAAVREQANLNAERKTKLGAIEQLKQRNERLERDLGEAKAQFANEQAAMSEARAELSRALDQMESDESEQADKLAAREQIRENLQRHREQARDTRDQMHRVDMQVQNLRTQIGTAKNAIQRLQEQATRLTQREAELIAQLPQDEDPDAVLRAELEQLLEHRMRAEEALSSARQRVSDKEQALRAAEQARMKSEQQVQQLHSQMESLRLHQAQRGVRVENLEAQLAELEVKAEDVVANLPEDASEPEWQVKVERISAKITRLGPINLAAIDECTRASERKNYLDAQNEDLESALETLENAIRKIDKETRTRFQDTFDRVNTGFSELFPKVFGGGTACLELTGDDLLDTGVSIMARPPGKKNSTIHLLSGGEKAMTAIALVFSIFQLNPAPFCMLDEVDAPLDDANVGRYARMVKEMSEKVQFIFITHNKITMEVADQLMGVTMHEPGVSRLVTVDVEEAAQLAAS